MQIVIDLDEKEFRDFVDNGKPISMNRLCGALYHGIPLPKGHGRLIDADRLKTHFVGTEQGTDLEVYLEPTIIEAPTIIPADKENGE